MLDSERAATLSISLIIALFVSHSQGKLINEVSCGSKLLVLHIRAFYLLEVVRSDVLDASLEPPCLFILTPVVLSFELGVSCQEDVFICRGRTDGIVLVRTEPSGVLLALDRAPTVARHVALGNGRVICQVYSNLLGLDPWFEKTGLWMFSSALE
jgi:hypothetical protein